MTKNEPDPRVQRTRDLLRSLQGSILRLRHEAETLQLRLAAEEDVALAANLPKITKLEGLIRDCQKVEKTLVEQTDPDTSGLDLDAARAEIRSRLDRLRAARATEELAGGDE